MQETKRSLQGLFNRFMCLIAQVTLQLYFCPDLSTLKNVLYKGRSKKETTILICYLLRNSRHGSMRRESSPLRLPQVEIRYLRDPFSFVLLLRGWHKTNLKHLHYHLRYFFGLLLRDWYWSIQLQKPTIGAPIFFWDHTRFRH